MAASLEELSRAVEELLGLHKRRLADLEELTHRHGIEPGSDMAFAGIRVLIARVEQVPALLRMLTPIGNELMKRMAPAATDTAEH
jgi:hypothetical protein